MAFEQVTRDMLTFDHNNINGRVQGYMSKDVRNRWEEIFSAVGPDAEFYNDFSKWGMLKFPNRSGSTGNPNQIVIKTHASTVNKIINLYRRDGRKKTLWKGEQNKNVIIKFKESNWEQEVKFQASGIKPRAASGKKISDTTFTAMQELGSAWILYVAFQEGKKGFNSGDEIRKDTRKWGTKRLTTYGVLQDIWKELGDTNGPDDEWLDNFVAQSKAVLGDSIAGKGEYTEFTRGYRHSSVGGPGKAYRLPFMKGGWTFMEYITNFVRTNFGITQKDNWNPADIWMIKDEAKHRKVINERCRTKGKSDPTADGKLQLLNEIMRGLYLSSDIVGVSLKKVSGNTARYEAINVTESFLQSREIGNPNTVGYEFELATCPLGTKQTKDGGVTLETQDSRFFIVDYGGDNARKKATYNFQIKGNNSRGFGGLKYEATQEGYGAARLGKATVEYVEKLLRDKGINFSTSTSQYPQTLEAFDKRVQDEYARYLRELNALPEFQMSPVGKDKKAGYEQATVEQAIDNLMMLFTTEPYVANSKLQQIKWLHSVLVTFRRTAGKEGFNRFCTELVFLSKKEGRSYGPFGKVY